MGSDPEPVGLAVIGAGTVTQGVHLPAVRRLRRRFTLRAVCDASPSRARRVAAEHGASVLATTSPAAAIGAAGVEAVLLATPGSHAELARACLAAGRHVLAEKPLSATVAAARALGRQAAAAGLVLQVGTMKTYDPLVGAAAQACRSVRARRLVRVTVCHPADASQVAHLRLEPDTDADPALVAAAEAAEARAVSAAIGPMPEPWGRAYRGLLLGSVVHEFALLRALGFGLPDRFEHAEWWPWPPAAATPPCILAVADLGADCRLVLSWNWLPEQPEYLEAIAVLGTDARVQLDVAAPYLLEARSRLTVERQAGALRTETVSRAGHESGFLRQLEAFADAVRGGAPPAADAAGAAADVAALQALIVALAQHAGVSVGGEAGRLGAAHPQSTRPGPGGEAADRSA